MARLGRAGLVVAWLGTAGRGAARLGLLWRGMAGFIHRLAYCGSTPQR